MSPPEAKASINPQDALTKYSATQPNHRSMAPKLSAPYGAHQFGTTNFSLLTTSLQQQFKDGGLPAPTLIDINPDPNWQNTTAHAPAGSGEPDSTKARFMAMANAAGQTTKEKIIANKIGNPDSFLQQNLGILEPIDGNHPSLRHKTSPIIDNLLYTFTALHEASHYVAYNTDQHGHAPKDGIDLNVALFDRLNKISPQTPQAYFHGLTATLAASKKENSQIQSALEEKGTFAFELLKSVQDKIADTSASLYLLSNYGDRAKTETFLKQYSNMRKAAFYDHVHDTSSSIDAAMVAFSKDPRKGMSIVETTQWAAEIVATQPDLNRNIAEMAHDVQVHNLMIHGAKTALAAHDSGKGKQDVYQATVKTQGNLSTKDKQYIKTELDKDRKAREAFLKFGFSRP